MSSLVASSPPVGWIHGPRTDLAIMFGPWVFGALAIAVWGFTQPSTALWLSQFVLGNTTHVVLTFVLLASRPDVLRATPTQPRLVVVGSIVTFVVAWAIFRGFDAWLPLWSGFPLAVAAIFGTHHRLSQAKGVWSLYNLRGRQLRAPAPSARERSLQQAWVSVGLVLVMVAWLFVPTGPDRSFPLFQAIPAEPAMLPYATSYALVAAWGAFVLALLVELGRGGRGNLPKMLHVATHGIAVAFAILAPVWGGIVWGAIHGLEYYFLCARMMTPRDDDAVAGPRAAWVWPIIVLSMLPLALVGLPMAPFASAFPSLASPAFREALVLLNALVMAHYFADAFIYRFRIPAVRDVALRRLGFA
jgi:hypothetical protein